jgi:hypothetical protein
MDAVQARLDASGVPGENGESGLPQAYLLGFDTHGDGHTIIANGNPDTADNTAVYVPGTGSKLENAGGDIKRMTETWREADAQAPGESTSTITWIGYDAPQSPSAQGHSQEPARRSYTPKDPLLNWTPWNSTPRTVPSSPMAGHNSTSTAPTWTGWSPPHSRPARPAT